MSSAGLKRPREIWLLVNHRTIAGRRLSVGAAIHTLAAMIGIAAFEAALAMEALGWLFSLKVMTTAGYWLILAAAVSLTLAVPAGMVTRWRWLKQTPPTGNAEQRLTRRALRRHAALGLCFYGLLMMITFWRIKLQWQAAAGIAVSGLYPAVLLVASLVMIFQVWLGGEVAVHFAVQQDRNAGRNADRS